MSFTKNCCLLIYLLQLQHNFTVFYGTAKGTALNRFLFRIKTLKTSQIFSSVQEQHAVKSRKVERSVLIIYNAKEQTMNLARDKVLSSK